MTDRLAFLASLREQPDDDAPYLAFADWLDENDEPALAEFVRVSVELERCGPCPRTVHYVVTPRRRSAVHPHPMIPPPTKPKKPCGWCPVCLLRARFAALLAAHEAAWRTCGKCETCAGKGKCYHRTDDMEKYRCETCGGCGDRGGLLRKFEYPDVPYTSIRRGPVRISWHKGLPRCVHVGSLAECGREGRVECPTCKAHCRRGQRSPLLDCLMCKNTGTVAGAAWQPSPWLVSVATWFPSVAAVRVGDREPSSAGVGNFLWWDGAMIEVREPDDVPAPLFAAMAADHPDKLEEIEGIRLLRFAAADAAHFALGKCLLDAARKPPPSPQDASPASAALR